MSDVRILVVEDELDGQEVVSTILEINGLFADVVGNAEAALQRLSQHVYNMAIIDIALPDMDGWQLLHEIRQHNALAQLPCVAITAYHDSSVKQKSIDVGFDAYLPKPLNADNLITTVDKLLGS